MVLLGLHGPAQSGKDTAFAAIKDEAAKAGYSAVRRGFADKLKLSVYRLFDPKGTLEQALAWCDEFKFNGKLVAFEMQEEPHPEVEGSASEWFEVPQFVMDGRQLLQRYGTEAHRDVFGSEFWVDALLPIGNTAHAVPRWRENFTVDGASVADIAVVTDVRFPNEAHRIHALGGKVWRINRVDLESNDGHASEQQLDDSLIDLVVENGHGVETYIDLISQLTRDIIIPDVEGTRA